MKIFGYHIVVKDKDRYIIYLTNKQRVKRVCCALGKKTQVKLIVRF